jgi:hypothetical protein
MGPRKSLFIEYPDQGIVLVPFRFSNIQNPSGMGTMAMNLTVPEPLDRCKTTHHLKEPPVLRQRDLRKILASAHRTEPKHAAIVPLQLFQPSRRLVILPLPRIIRLVAQPRPLRLL